MPKENIDCMAIDGVRVEVSWTAGSHVQIATTNANSPFEFPEKRDANQYEPAEAFDGWRVSPDRDGINRLIRALRKARDAAFGADA